MEKQDNLFRVIAAITLIAICILAPIRVSATQAKSSQVKIEQPDGTVLTIIVCGDEHFHYTTTIDGYTIAQRDGIYYYAAFQSSGELIISDVKAKDPVQRTLSDRSIVRRFPKGVSSHIAQSVLSKNKRYSRVNEGLITGFPTKGNVRSLVILVNFTDEQFQYSKGDFQDLLNKKGYSVNGGTGSVKDYFEQNSMGQFIPDFDVFGPVTLDHPMEYYGGNNRYGYDKDPESMIAEACEKAKQLLGVDFSVYDYNNDGDVDNVFVYYAGYNEAEGADANTVWPQRSELERGRVLLDGKNVIGFACTSEMSGTPKYDSRMAGIGTFCHEFGHVLGWPDFYDTNNDEDGLSDGVWNWSLMCSGNYNNKGRTPPAVSAMERIIVEWLSPAVITKTNNYQLKHVSENEAYILETDNDGEYFVLENRQLKGWDKYLEGHGLLIFHVDRSERIVSGQSAIKRWYYNSPNNVKEHECYRIITARPGAGGNYKPFMPFPGPSANTEFSKKSNPANISWTGKYAPVEILNIKEQDEIISFRAVSGISGVESVKIEGQSTISLGDTTTLKCVVLPDNAENKKIKWESSDPAVIEINETGFVRAKKPGQVVIKAISEDSGCEDSKRITVNSDQILRGRLISSAGNKIENVLITIRNKNVSKTFTTDTNGEFSSGIGDLPQGEYEIIYEHSSFPYQNDFIQIKEGTTLLNLLILSQEELENGTSDFNIMVNTYQKSAYITWEGSKAQEWSVQWKGLSEKAFTSNKIVSVNKINIEGLEAGKEYLVRIYERQEGNNLKYNLKQFTTGIQTSDYPMIAISSIYKKGDAILLKALNLPDGAKIIWKSDDVMIEDPEYIPPAGEHKIDLIIENKGVKEIITKYIKVVE